MNTSTASPRSALVFGGSRGIGAAIAQRLAQDGFDVGLTFVSRPDKAAEVVREIEATGRRALALEADSADAAAIQSAVERTVAEFGPLQVVVVNAGLIRVGTVENFSTEDLDRILAVNVRGVFLAIQAASCHLRDGGRVITIGSNTAVRSSVPGTSAYMMSKAAVAAMVRGIAVDLAPRRITVNNIQPGPTETDITAGMIPRLTQMVPLGRIAQPQEIAALASYLANEASGYMTGSSLTIDGGFVL